MIQTILFILAIIFGIAVSCGFIAFIALIGIIPRLASKTQTADHIVLYESMVTAGIFTANIVYLYEIPLPFHQIGLLFLGLLFGVFTGCLAGALAEIVDIFPIASRRLQLHKGLPYALSAIAIGKTFGTIIQWFIFK